MKTKELATPRDAQIGLAVKDARTAKGWSQTKLANACGVTFQQIQKYETGRNRITAVRLEQIATALETSVMDLYYPLTPDVEIMELPPEKQAKKWWQI